MKNREIVKHINELSKFSDVSIPITLSYWIARNNSILISANAAYETSRNKLLDKYAVRDAEGKVMFTKEGAPVFSDDNALASELNELLDIDVQVSIGVVDYSVIDGYNISFPDINSIMFMLVNTPADLESNNGNQVTM